MDQQVLLVITFLFYKNWSTDLFQLVHAEKKENGCSTSN